MIEARIPDGRRYFLAEPLRTFVVFAPEDSERRASIDVSAPPQTWHLRLVGVRDGVAYYEHTTPAWKVSRRVGWTETELLGIIEAPTEDEAKWQAWWQWPRHTADIVVERMKAAAPQSS